jgi:glycosyltransferase involved in cell wall biosynthesis
MLKSRFKISIVTPCYNEELSLKKLVNNCLEHIKNDVEIILVDNGSTDKTYNSLLSFNLPFNIVPVRVEENLGYGNGILYGLNLAKGEVLSWTHADLQTDVSDVLKGYKKFENELISKKCMVKGERKNRNLLDFFFTFCMGIYSSIFLNKWMYDINAQPKIFHRSFLEEFNNFVLEILNQFELILFILNFSII